MIDWNILEVRFNLLFVSDTCRHKSNLEKGEIDSNFSSGKYITYENKFPTWVYIFTHFTFDGWYAYHVNEIFKN